MSPREQRRIAIRTATCLRKRRHETWDEARIAGLAVYRENPSSRHLNPPLPYPCTIGGEKHYHCGHRQSERLAS